MILGATGSIGEQAIAVARRRGDDIVGLAARRPSARLLELADALRPRFVACDGDPQLPPGTALLQGPQVLEEAARWPDVDCVVVAVNGFAGLRPTLAALAAGRRVAIATKEALVAGGRQLTQAVREERLLPVDSEHAALWQLLRGRPPQEVRRGVLTASGGALRDWPLERLAEATAADALRHPTWRMGAKITVDSATLINKGIELLEAAVLFGLPLERLDVWLHPQSIAHALVETVDGAMYAQFAVPDMALAIEQALRYPALPRDAVRRLDLDEPLHLDFSRPDPLRYPALRLCRAVGKIGGTMPAVMNAANEVAVAAFLDGRLPFTGIVPLIEAVVERHQPVAAPDLDALTQADDWGRRTAAERVAAGGALKR